jgi:hypothetical protein
VKYLCSQVNGKINENTQRYSGIVVVTLRGRTFLLRRHVTETRRVVALSMTKRQVLKVAAKKTKYHWNIPFFV